MAVGCDQLRQTRHAVGMWWHARRNVTSIAISPRGLRIAPGKTVPYVASPTFIDTVLGGHGATVRWSSSVPAVATVTSAGVVTARTPGATRIRADFRGRSDSVDLVVTGGALASISVYPESASVTEGTSLQLKAMGSFDDGTRQAMDEAAWVSENPAALAAGSGGSPPGLVRAIRPGGGEITVRVGGLSATARIKVTPARPASGPLRVSAANPRYFADPTGRPIFLTGAHYWKTLQDNGTTDPPPAFDYGAYLDFLQAHNHNFFRLWYWEQASGTSETAIPNWFSPLPYQRTGPGVALDGKPRFDLTRFHPEFFDRLRQRIIEAGRRGIYVSVMLFDGWSIGTKPHYAFANPWRTHPFHRSNNINGVDGDPNHDDSGREIETLQIPAVTALQEAYVWRVIDAVGDLDNVLYEITNEGDSTSIEWQYHMIGVIRAYEATRAKQHPVGMTQTWPGGTRMALFRSQADWISPNGQLDDPPETSGEKVIIADTDHLCGICGTIDWVWKSATRGENPLFMDGYDGSPGVGEPAHYDPHNPVWADVRRNLGYARRYLDRMDLRNARPRRDLSSSGYCLAESPAAGARLLVFLPGGKTAAVNLEGYRGPFRAEWLDPATGAAYDGGVVPGGTSHSFNAPFGGDAVLFLQ
jgi:Family of unknown function (DUF6298)/Bacterial Ig-like domain (group 2)/Putative collagen-binding domain of a collagenase